MFVMFLSSKHFHICPDLRLKERALAAICPLWRHSVYLDAECTLKGYMYCGSGMAMISVPFLIRSWNCFERQRTKITIVKPLINRYTINVVIHVTFIPQSLLTLTTLVNLPYAICEDRAMDDLIGIL